VTRRAVLACLPVIVAAVVAGFGGYALRRRLAPSPKPLEVIRVERPLPRSERVNTDDAGALALSADGRVFVAAVRSGAGSALLLQYLDKFDATEIAGTAGASSPFLSADGTTIGFVAADGRLESVPSGGGDPAPLLAPNAPTSGAAFGPENQLFAGQRQGGLLRRTSAGSSAFTTLAESERAHEWPHWTTGSDAVVFTIEYSAPKPSAVAIARLANPGTHVVVGPGRRGWFLDAAHLLVARDDGLWRVDLGSGTAAKESRITAEAALAANGTPIAATGGGHLIYMSAASGDGLITGRFDQPGLFRYLSQDRLQFSQPRLSPDGKSVAVVETVGPRRFALSIYDAVTGVRTTTIATTAATAPLWTADSRWVLFPDKTGDGWQLSWLSREAREGVGKVLTESSSARLRTPGVDAEWIVGDDSCVRVSAGRRGVERPIPSAIASGLATDGCGDSNYDVSSDGSRFVAVYHEPVTRPSTLRYVLNFAAGWPTPR
jgi:hypothetical protein